MKVKKYTDREGGKWLPWASGEIEVPAVQPRRPGVEISGVVVHSLVTEENQRWDCINGWTGENRYG